MLPLASWVVLILARLPFFWIVWKNPAICLAADSSGYLQSARNLAQHAAFSESVTSPWIPSTFRVPAYPVFLSFFTTVFNDPVPWIASSQIMLSLLTVVILSHWLRALGSPRQSALVATLIGLDLASLIQMPLILTETFFSFTLALAVWGTWKALQESSSLKAFLCGGLWSLSLMTRPIAFYFPPVVALIWLRNRKYLLCFLLGAYFLPGLWILRNWKVTGHAVYSTQGGVELLRCPGAAVESLRTGVPWSIVWPRMQEDLNQQFPDNGLFAYERSQVASRMAMGILTHHPFLLMRHCLLGTIKTLAASSFITPVRWWNPSFEQDTNFQSNPRVSQNLNLFRQFPVLIPLQIAYAIYLLFFYVYWVKGLHRLWTSGRKQEAWLLFAGVVYFIVLASVEGQSRYRIPIMPFLAGTAVAGLAPRREE